MKITKQLQDLEMKLIKEKRIKIFKSLLFYLTLNLWFTACTSSVESKLIGVWQIDHVDYNDQNTSTVPENERYSMELSKENNKKKLLE